MRTVTEVEIVETGLVGDRQARANQRSVTLLQAEHVPVIAALAHRASLNPSRLRRNLLVSGLNLSAMRGRVLALGSVEIEVTGPCAPCSRMEEALGAGGYTAMRGHGGVTACVRRPGSCAIGDPVRPVTG